MEKAAAKRVLFDSGRCDIERQLTQQQDFVDALIGFKLEGEPSQFVFASDSSEAGKPVRADTYGGNTFSSKNNNNYDERTVWSENTAAKQHEELLGRLRKAFQQPIQLPPVTPWHPHTPAIPNPWIGGPYTPTTPYRPANPLVPRPEPTGWDEFIKPEPRQAEEPDVAKKNKKRVVPVKDIKKKDIYKRRFD